MLFRLKNYLNVTEPSQNDRKCQNNHCLQEYLYFIQEYDPFIFNKPPAFLYRLLHISIEYFFPSNICWNTLLILKILYRLKKFPIDHYLSSCSSPTQQLKSPTSGRYRPSWETLNAIDVQRKYATSYDYRYTCLVKCQFFFSKRKWQGFKLDLKIFLPSFRKFVLVW